MHVVVTLAVLERILEPEVLLLGHSWDTVLSEVEMNSVGGKTSGD